MGYQRNDYEWSVMKKIIHDKKFTIIWHINGLNTLHVDPAIISNVFSDIDAEYANIFKNDHHAGQSA